MELLIEGKLNPKSLDRVKGVLNQTLLKESIVVFCSFSRFEFNVGHIFRCIAKESDPEICLIGEFELIAVTTQLCNKMNQLPEGYKTICQILVGEEIHSKLIMSIPEVGNWYEYEDRFIIK